MKTPQPSVAIVPMLYLNDLSAAIEFYKKAFGAEERWQIEHEGRTHVAEMIIGSVLLRMHEEITRENELSPLTLNATSVGIELLVNNPDELFAKAVATGATVISPMQDHDYGYRGGTIRDPFGHHWCLERMDDLYKVPNMREKV